MGIHPDLHRIAPDGAGDQVRLPQVTALISDLVLLPLEGRIRVAIVSAAHRMNEDAQNALLKTLEEPSGAACIVLCADEPGPILPTVASRCMRIRLGRVAPAEIEALLVERGIADPPRARAAAVASEGLPGLAAALAADPESAIVSGRLARSLLDLTGATRAARLGAVAGLMADGAALDAILRGEPAAGDPGAADAEAAEAPARPARGGRATRGTGPRRPQPAERRRAVLRVIDTWRSIARDLLLAGRGGRRSIHHVDLLEELEAAARTIDPADLLRFVERLDALAGAIAAYAGPELLLDHLVLSWPRAARAA